MVWGSLWRTFVQVVGTCLGHFVGNFERLLDSLRGGFWRQTNYNIPMSQTYTNLVNTYKHPFFVEGSCIFFAPPPISSL